MLGDLGVDEFVHGDIERVSREAPVLILREREIVTVPGGAGNAVANLRALDALPVPIGVVGRDPSGRRLLARFRESGIGVSSIVVDGDYHTPAKSRVLAGGVHTRRQQVVRLDRGAVRGELRPALVRELRRRLEVALRRAEGLLVADYGYGAATPELVAAVLARRRGPLVFTVDSRARVARYAGAAACTPNQEELEQALGIGPVEDDAGLERAGRALLRRSRSETVLLTRGARGMSVFQRRRATVSIPAYGPDEVADVTGAGDTVIAVFSLALLAGASPVEAACLANYAAGLVVMKSGTATVSRAELLRAIREDLA